MRRAIGLLEGNPNKSPTLSEDRKGEFEEEISKEREEVMVNQNPSLFD